MIRIVLKGEKFEAFSSVIYAEYIMRNAGLEEA